MPIRHCIVHLIDKKPDGTPAVLHARDSELAESSAIEHLLADLNDSYNAKQGKAWDSSMPNPVPTPSAVGSRNTWTEAATSPSSAASRWSTCRS